MPTIKCEMRGLKELEAALGRLHPLFVAEVRNMMTISLDLMEQLVVKYTPVGATAALRGSISSFMEGSPETVLLGHTVHGMLYGDAAETGRAPGRAPMEMRNDKLAAVPGLVLWVTRKLGASGDEAEAIAFAIARSIGRKGTKGAHMFEKAFKEGGRRLILFWADLPRYVLEKAGLAK